MLRWTALAVAGALMSVPGLPAQDGIGRGKIKQIDAEKGTVTIAVDGEAHVFRVAADTRIMDAAGKPAKDGLRHAGFKEGTAVMFKAEKRDGKPVLVGLKPAGASRPEENRQKPEKVDTSKLIPLTDLDGNEYHGYKGGLYPDGKNERPAGHEAAGLALARQIQPLDAEGKPSPDGKIVLLSVGMSNTNQSFAGFLRVAKADHEINPRVVLVNGAQGGMSASVIQNEDSGGRVPNRRAGYWQEVDNILKKAGVTRAQVQAVWIKEADPGPSQGFPGYAKTLQAELLKIVQIVHRRFPNLKLAYLSSRTYGGWAKTRLRAYLSRGFSSY